MVGVGMPQQPQDTLQRVNSVGQAGPRMQHAIPERLLTASQASALLSGLPPGSQSAWLKQQGGFVGYTDPPDSLVTGNVL